MNNLPIEIINHIMRFNSHPLADIARDNIISTRFGKYYYIGDRLRWMFSEESDFIDGYETYVIEQHIKNHYNIKYIRDIKRKKIVNAINFVKSNHKFFKSFEINIIFVS